MDIFKDKRNHTQGGTKHINKPTTNEERTQEIAPSLFVCTSEREKETTKTKQERKAKTRGQAKESRRRDTRTGIRAKG